MKRVLFIGVLAYVFFLAEFLLFNCFGPWGRPHFLIILVVFFDLYLGIRYSLWAAVAAGVFKDAYSLELLGTHILAYMACAYVTIFIRRNFYQPGSWGSRRLAVALCVVVYSVVLLLVHAISGEPQVGKKFFQILLPEVALTALAARWVFEQLKIMAIRFNL